MSEALFRLQTLSFEGAASYRQPTPTIPLANLGRVLICGPEGSGKSMIPEVATLLLYGKGSHRAQTTGFNESSIVNKDTGYLASLTFKSGTGAAARSVTIEHAFKHRRAGSRYAIYIDGKKDETTGKPAQKALIKRLAPLSYREWLGSVYLAQHSIHDLLLNSPTQKRAYLTSFFGLDFYDDLRTEALEEADRLRKQATDATSLRERFVDLSKELREAEEKLATYPPRAEVEGGLRKLHERLMAVSKELGRIASLQKAQADRERLEGEMKDLLKEGGWKNFESASKAMEKAKARLPEAQEQRASLIAQVKRLAEQNSAYETTRAMLERLEEEEKDRLANLASLRVKAKTIPSREGLEKAQALIIEASNLGLGALAVSTKKASGSWQEAAERARDARRTLGKVRKLKASDQACPTCTQPLTDDILERLTADLEASEAKAEAAAIQGFWKAFTPLMEGKALHEDVEDLSSLNHRVQQALNIYRVMETILRGQEESEEELTQLRSLPNEKPPDPEKLKAQVNELSKELPLLEGVIRKVQKLSGLRTAFDALAVSEVPSDEERERLEAQKESLGIKHQAAIDLQRELDAWEYRVTDTNKRLVALQFKLDEHAAIAELLKDYEDTLIPYFETLRSSKVRSRVSVLENILPAYVSAFATSSYKGAALKFEVSDDLESIDLLLKPSRFGPWVSALQASGGQRQRFMLAIYCGQYEVSPRKANVLWLDEPFTGMESEGKVIFINRVLPMLKERTASLESVFVISHDQEVLSAANDSFDSVWTVERDERGSHIQMGQKLAAVAGR